MKKTQALSEHEGIVLKTSRESIVLTIRKWLALITWEGAFATVFITFTGGAFLTGLALYLGANDFVIGLLASIPFLAQVAQLFSAYLVDWTGKRKAITLWNSIIARQLWWLLLPILFLPGAWRLQALIGVMIISNIAIMIATPAWQSWMADLVPDRIRARYFGLRSAAVAIAVMVTTVIGSLVLDHFRSIHQEHVGFVIILGFACLFALIAAILLNKLPDRPLKALKTGISWKHAIEPLKNKTYRHLLGFASAWNFAVGIAAAFFAVHMLTNLGMNFTQISLYTSIASIIAILLNRPWGKVIDRFGSKPVIAFCAFGLAVVPMIWLIPRPGYIWILWFEAAYASSLWTGFNLAAFNIPIANSPREGRTLYLAMFAMVSGLAFFVSSIIGGALAHHLTYVHWQVGRQSIVNYHILFIISSLMRLAAAFLVLTFREPKEKAMPVMFQYMGNSVLRWFSIGRHIFPGWFRR